jgi:hypothetical protein
MSKRNKRFVVGYNIGFLRKVYGEPDDSNISTNRGHITEMMAQMSRCDLVRVKWDDGYEGISTTNNLRKRRD